MKHKITLLLLLSIILFMDCSTCNAATIATDTSSKKTQQNSVSNVNETVSPCSDVIEWRYIVISGSTYRRLYNVTTGEWIGVWELVS